MSNRSFIRRAWYEFMRVVVWTIANCFFRIRCFGLNNLPRSGGYLLLSNHQSHLDPPLIGLFIARQVNYLARQSLFKNKLFTWLINSLDAIPIDREGLGLSGLKETLRRLKRGEIVLLFPEGTRTRDGDVQPLKPGFSVLAQRAGVPMVPVALDGAYQSWPKGQLLPCPTSIHIVFGEPIMLDEAKHFEDRALVQLVAERIGECHAQARSRRRQILNEPD